MSIISIGVQSGGPKDGDIGVIKIDLYKAFNESCTSSYCEAIDEYAPVIRVMVQLANLVMKKLLGYVFLKNDGA